MREDKLYRILGIDSKQDDCLAQIGRMFNSAGIWVMSKSPDRTLYQAIDGGRVARELDALTDKGLFTVSGERKMKIYEPTHTFVKVWRKYQTLKENANQS